MSDLPAWPGRLDLESLAWEEVQATPPRWAVETPPVNPDKFCAHCGRICGDFKGGFASYNGEPLCHPNEADRPDCYKLVQAGHPMPCLNCLRDSVSGDVNQITEDWLKEHGEAEGF